LIKYYRTKAGLGKSYFTKQPSWNSAGLLVVVGVFKNCDPVLLDNGELLGVGGAVGEFKARCN
jgi:hypothetical protein